MNYLVIVLNILSIYSIKCSYNPIPRGSVIISTTRSISILEPKEYGGHDKATIIYSAIKTMTIINTIFDFKLRQLFILYTNSTSDDVFIQQLISVEKLGPIIYRLPFLFNITRVNRLTSFSSDADNKRAFFIDEKGVVTMFSMSGTMKSTIKIPKDITEPVRSVAFSRKFNRLFVITDTTVSACANLDENELDCCQAQPKTYKLRSIVFNPIASQTYAYVMDEFSGLYQVRLNETNGCPIALRPMDTMDPYENIHLAVDQNLFVCTGSTDQLKHNSILILSNGIHMARTIPFNAPIVALHISYLNTKTSIEREETCFHGITYHDYRVAVILAAVFGTIMGIFMCCNALFCIDFFMTKQIIRNLKSQIPRNLLEDRWNRLVEEKYAKLALEIHRKKNDPPSQRKSLLSTIARKNPLNDNEWSYRINPLPRFSAYLRRKSESYLNRRQTDETQSTATLKFPTIHQEEDQKVVDKTLNSFKSDGELL